MPEATIDKKDVNVTDEIDFSALDEKTQEIIKKLRRENASYRTRAREATDENSELKKYRDLIKEAEEKKLAEQGEYRKLLDEKEKAIAELKTKADKSNQYEEHFQKDLEIKLKGLKEEDAEFVKSSDLPLVKKIELAQRLTAKAETNSPGAARPGASTPSATEIFTGLDTEKDSRKKAEMLMGLKVKNPKLYEEYTRKYKE